MMAEDARLLIFDPATEATVGMVRSRFPNLAVETCADPAGLGPLLDRFRPGAVFVSLHKALGAADWHALVGHPTVRWLQIGSVGYDPIPRWDPGRLTVTNSGGAGASEMAEYVIASILMANTGFVAAAQNQRDRKWQQNWWAPLKGKTLAVVGVGGIGSQIIERARYFGMHIIAVRSKPEATPGADLTLPTSRLREALAQADFVSVQVPLGGATRHLFGPAEFDAMRPGAWIVNVSRGPVLDEASLTVTLEHGRIGGAVLDVFDTEPLPVRSRLWELPNVVVTPHISGCVTSWYETIAEMFCENLDRFCAGTPLRNVVGYQA